MISAVQTRHRLLRERLAGVVRQAEPTSNGLPDSDSMRLAAAALALLERHGIDREGRCQRCRRGGYWWWQSKGRQRCLVYAVLNFYLMESTTVVRGSVGVSIRAVVRE